jgi:hypothetical protein
MHDADGSTAWLLYRYGEAGPWGTKTWRIFTPHRLGETRAGGLGAGVEPWQLDTETFSA